MKLLLDFFPLVVFFAAFKFADVYVATGVAMAATVIQIAILRWRTGKVEPMQWASLAIIAVFGGATIALHNEAFIKWKPTVLYWLMGGVPATGQLVFRKNLLKSVMGSQVQLPDPIWRVTTWTWAGFFAALGLLNLWVAFNFDTATWVNFKVFGAMGLIVVFLIGLAFYWSRHMPEEAGDRAEP